jgi:hypothetical protein
MGTDYLVDSCSPDYALGGMGGAVAGMVGPGGPAKGAMFAMKGAKAATSITRGQLAVPAFLQAIAAADMVDNGQTLMKHFKNYVNSGDGFVEGIGKLKQVQSKGGDTRRDRYVDKKGNIYEADTLHGRLEVYNKWGDHQEEIDLEGNQTGRAKKNRHIQL